MSKLNECSNYEIYEKKISIQKNDVNYDVYYLMDTSSTGPPFPPLNKKAKGHEIQVCLEWEKLYWQPKLTFWLEQTFFKNSKKRAKRKRTLKKAR